MEVPRGDKNHPDREGNLFQRVCRRIPLTIHFPP
jgi:hypothetical protein